MAVTDPELLTFQNGLLAFSAQAMGDGPIVLCLHGFPDNAGSFRHQLPVLAEAGYRAVSLTLRGYEPRSIPTDGDYTIETVATDILAVIDSLNAGPVHLIGHDWGAAVAYVAAAAAPERFRSLTVMAVPHAGRFARDGLRIPRQLRLSWYMGLFNIPWLSDWIVSRRDYRFIRWLWRDWSPSWQPEPGVLEGVISTLSQPGVRSAALGYYRAALSIKALLVSVEEAHYSVPVPTLALSGERDGCIASDVFEELMVAQDFPQGLTFSRIPQAGHFLHQEQPGRVNRKIVDWLKLND
ncbi:MAG: alpha/beta fold hydrolase [Halieaceae bacterium]|nr:MAG: alpha/beta fold hydrolase [Halieaceae bacterium]|tara:strand:+ start:846 stop:1730 length:885 start_codon:yes stop_codon:yes gene_type:complete